VTDTQQAYTRSGSNLQLNGPLVPAFDKLPFPTTTCTSMTRGI